MQFTVPPSIIAAKSHYTAITGSNITLKCNITDQGVPQAEFRWRRDGTEVINDNVTVLTSYQAIIMIITHLTMSDAGIYTCEAANEQSYRNDHVELIIEPLVIHHEGKL